jgi:hypothetical protein
MVDGPVLFLETPGCHENVLLEVLLDLGVVLLDKIGVVGFLRCHSLTRKSRERRQGCVELGEVWGDFPFLSRVVALNRMIRNRFVARSS